MAPTTSEECLTFLDEAKQALQNIRDLTARETDCKQKDQQSKRSYEAEKKRMNDEISRTLRSRREDIVKSYDDEIDKDQDQLKKARSDRERARNEGVKGRIADETQDMEKDISSLRTQIKNLGQSGHLPAYCRSQLYMSLYYPKHPRDILTLFIGILIFFALIPCLIYLAIPARKPVYLIVIYVILFVAVLGLYVYVGSRTNRAHAEALKECRGLFDQIYEKKKAIETTTKAIRKDKNEGVYDLGRYDDDISRIQQDLDDVTGRKQAALDNYENVTKNILTDEIEGNYRDKLEGLSKEQEEAGSELRDVSAQLQTERLNFSDNYSQLLGKEFSDPVKIDSLTQIVKDQNCQNISEAIAYYKANEKQIKADERARTRKNPKAAAAEPASEEQTTESAAAESVAEPAAAEPVIDAPEEEPAAEESAVDDPDSEASEEASGEAAYDEDEHTPKT